MTSGLDKSRKVAALAGWYSVVAESWALWR
jgi:hypothetical protein